MKRAVAYIRRSSGQDSPLSREAQESAIAAVAASRGEAISQTFVDWGRSGGDKKNLRSIASEREQFLAMLDEVEAGRVSTVYIFDGDRIARRTATTGILLDIAASVGSAVVDRHGRDLAGRDRLTGE